MRILNNNRYILLSIWERGYLFFYKKILNDEKLKKNKLYFDPNLNNVNFLIAFHRKYFYQFLKFGFFVNLNIPNFEDM